MFLDNEFKLLEISLVKFVFIVMLLEPVYSQILLFVFFHSTVIPGPPLFPPESPATSPVPLPYGVDQKYAMSSSIRAKTVFRETLPGQ